MNTAFLSALAPVVIKTAVAKEEKKANESAEGVLTLAIRFAVEYLTTPCWAIDKRIPPADLTRGFTTGYWLLRAADRFEMC